MRTFIGSTTAIASLALAGCSAEQPVPANDSAVVNGTVMQTPAATPSPMASPSEAAADGRVFRYTSLAECRVVEAKPDEAGFSRAECPALGGYGVQLVDADGRQNLTIRQPSGTAFASLRLSELAGGGFTSLGEQLEWRGTERDGTFVPDALVVRQNVAEDPAQPTRQTSYLVAVRLTGTACAIGRTAPGPDQNARARVMADSDQPCPPR